MDKIRFCAVYGKYRMSIDRRGDIAQVSVYDVSNLKYPLMWSKSLTNEQADAAKEMFEAIGYFEIA